MRSTHFTQGCWDGKPLTMHSCLSITRRSCEMDCAGRLAEHGTAPQVKW